MDNRIVKRGVLINTSTVYKTEIHKGFVGEKEITVRSMIPVFESRDELEKQKMSIESGLYKIFAKYINA